MRFSITARAGHTVAAVLDLKGAYPSLPRWRLLKALKERLAPNTASMITQILTPDTVSIVGDPTSKTTQLRVGVPEWSPVSPLLFNLSMDTLAVHLAAVHRDISEWPENMFADNVELQAKTNAGLHILLDISTD